MKWVRKRRLFLGIIVLVVTLGGAGSYVFLTRTSASLSDLQSQADDALRVLDTQVAELKTRKEKERLAGIAAEAAKTESASSISSSDCNVSGRYADPTRIDVVVNKKHCIQPLSYAPSDLTGLDGVLVSGQIAPNLRAMMAEAAAAGLPLSITSGYRSYYNQRATYNYWVSQSGRDGADTYSARPGYSEHQTGFAVDLATSSGCSLSCFGSSPQYAWMQQNAARFGFIQRYYKGQETITGYSAEEWHYRYVGAEAALELKQKGLNSLETLWDIPGGSY